VLLRWPISSVSQMVQSTIKKHQRPAALKKRIERMKVQLKTLEDLLAATPSETQGAHLPATPPEGLVEPQ